MKHGIKPLNRLEPYPKKMNNADGISHLSANASTTQNLDPSFTPPFQLGPNQTKPISNLTGGLSLPFDLFSSRSSVLLHERFRPLHVQLDSSGESIFEVAEGVAFRREHLKRSMIGPDAYVAAM